MTQPNDNAAKDIAVKDIVSCLRHAGRDRRGEYITIQDALNVPNAGIIFKRAITEIIQNSVQPKTIGTSLVRNILQFTNDSQVVFRTLGAVGLIDFEIGEEGIYPEITAGRGQSSTIRSDVKKFGALLKISEEQIAQSQWDMVSMYINEVVFAMAQYKDKMIFDMLANRGRVVFDNLNPNSSEIGRTGGYNIAGAGNGAMTHEDLISMWASIATRGYRPNVLLVHPMHWAMFAKDPVMREMGVHMGDISQWLDSQVNPYNAYDRINAWNADRLAADGSRQELTSKEQDILTTSRGPQIPAWSPLAGIAILTSENVPYDELAQTATVIMLDTQNSGALIVTEDLNINEYDEKANDIKVIKLREKYALATIADGAAIAIARNVALAPNELFVNPEIHLTNVQPIVRK